MATVRELITKLGFETDSKGLKDFESKLSGLKSKIGNVAGAVAKAGAIVSGVATGAFGIAAYKGLSIASDLEEQQNVIDKTFGASAESMNKWAKDAINAYGLSELQAKQMTGTMGAMLKASGFVENEFTNMSKTLVGLSADFASFYNLNNEDAFRKIQSGIRGETEPLKSLGIMMSEANLNSYALNQGLGKTVNQMSEMEKMQLRYNYLLSVTKDQQGDFANGLETSWANYKRVLSGNWTQLMSETFKEAVPYIIQFTKYLNQSITTVRKFVEANSEKIAAFWKNLAKTIAKVYVNIVIWLEDLSTRTNKFSGFRNLFLAIFNIIKSSIKYIAKALVYLAPAFDFIANAIAGIINFINKHAAVFRIIAIGIGIVIAALSSPILAIIAAVLAVIAIVIILYKNWDKVSKFIVKTTKIIANFFVNIGKSIKESLMKVGQFILNGLFEIFVRPFINIYNAIVFVFSTVYVFFSNIFSKAVEFIKEKFGVIVEWFSSIWQSIKDVFFDVVNWFGNIFNEAVEKIKDVFSPLLNWFSDIFNKIGDSITGAFDALKNKLPSWAKKLLGIEISSDTAMTNRAGASSAYTSTINSPHSDVKVDMSGININMPEGTTKEQAEEFGRAISTEYSMKYLDDVINSSLATVPTPEYVRH